MELKLSKLLMKVYMSEFCASIVLAFILELELFDYVVDLGGNLRELGRGEKAKWVIWPQMGRKIKPSGCHDSELIYGLKMGRKIKHSGCHDCKLIFAF